MSIAFRVMTVACLALAACGETNENQGWVMVPVAQPVPPATTVVVLQQPTPASPAPLMGPSTVVVLRNVASQRCLDVPHQAKESRTMLWSWDCNGTVAQRWTMMKEDDGGYHLISRASGKCLDVPNSHMGKNITLWQDDCNGAPGQRWDVEPAADGTVTLRSRMSHLCLDVPHGSPSNGIGVQQYPCHGGTPQQWILTRA